MMNWSWIILGLVALSSVSYAENSYLVILPKLLKVGYDNQISCFIASAPEPVEVKFDLVLGEKHLDWKIICKPGETRNATWILPKEFPVGAAELTITGTGGLRFVEKRDMIVYDNRHVMLIQTSASNYFPRDMMEVRVVVTDEHLIPMEDGVLDIEIYDAALKLVGDFPRIPIRSGLTETLRFPIAEHCNVGTWMVSAIIGNTTSSVHVLVAHPITPSFDLKAMFQRFLLRTEKFLRGFIEIADDKGEPIFGRGKIYIGRMTEQELEVKMKREMMMMKDEPMKTEEWRKWKYQEIEIAGRLELNYELLSLFNIDISKCIAIEVYCEVTDLISGQERVIRHIIPVFTHNVIYDIRPLEFEAGIKNEYELMAKRPDGKPVKMEDVIVTCRMIIGDEHGKPKDEKVIEIKDFYTRGRNDIGFFNVEYPENCIGVMMTITPLGEDGKMRGYRTHALPLMPTPRRHSCKLSIELLPSKVAPVNTDVDVPVISSQISTVGRTSNFYVQLFPIKPVEKFEPLPMSWVLMTNGRITLTGEFFIEPTKECRSKTVRSIRPEEQMPLECVFNGTLPIYITRDMVPYSTLLIYTFQPSWGYHVAESYRFSVAGLFQSSLTLNATLVPFTPMEKMIDLPFWKEMDVKPIRIPSKVQERTRVELSYTGVPDSTVGLNVFEYDGVLRGLTTEITKERLLKYLTTYEHVPTMAMPRMSEDEEMMRRREMVPNNMNMMMDDTRMPVYPDSRSGMDPSMNMPVRRTISEHDEEVLINRERMGHEVRYPVEKMIFGLESTRMVPPVEGDDIYLPSHMGRLYGDVKPSESLLHYRRRFEKSMNQYDVTIGDNDYVVATSMPRVFTAEMKPKHEKRSDMPMMMEDEGMMMRDKVDRERDDMPTWFEKMNSKLTSFTPEAYKFMQSGLTIVSDFDSLRIPTDMKRENLTKLFWRFHRESTRLMDDVSFSMRDEARELLEEYITRSDLSLMMPPIMFEEQARTGYYRSIFFNTSRIESNGMGKVVLPRMKPYSTWLATGFALNTKSGLSIASPIRLPTTEGLFVLADCPEHVKVREHVLFTYGINNYLRKDVSNVMFRIRASPDFDLIDPTKPEIVMSMKDKDYTWTLPLLKMYDNEIRHLIIVPKRSGVLSIICEVESEFGGDYEMKSMFVREFGYERKELTARLFDLTSDKKFGPIVEKWTNTPSLRSVKFVVSGTGVDRLVKPYTPEMNSLVGIDRALICLYRALGLRRYLNETMQWESPLYKMTMDNITTCYEHLQVYSDYDGSYSFISDEGTKHSSLYLTSLAFGAMISPMMPFRDNVTLNRTLTWILSHQREDGSFDDEGPCFHYRYCTGEFRRESLTAIVLYSLTRDYAIDYMPEFIRHRLYRGEMSPIMRATRYLISRVPDVKPHLLPITLFEMAFIQNREITVELREKIHEALLSRKLTVDPEDSSRYLKIMDDKMTYDDQLLINSMTVSLYSWFGDYKTSADIARWVVDEIENHPYYDTILDAVFRTDAWLKLDCLFRKKFSMDKYGITIDVTADNGEKKVFKIDSKNMDVTQMMYFTLPVHQITYSVSGFGLACVRMVRMYSEEKPEKLMEPMPFLLSHEFKPMPWFSEITCKTCMTYAPTVKDLVFPKDFNRTMVVEMILPSGMRINERQIGFFLSRVEYVKYFTYEPRSGKLSIFINVPSTMFNKEICFEWCLERLSTVFKWSPMYVRVYDYLRPDFHLVKLYPMQFQPSVLGYSFVEAVHKARPTLESLPVLQKKQL